MAALAQPVPEEVSARYVSKYPNRQPIVFDYTEYTREQLLDLALLMSDTFYDLVELDKQVELDKSIPRAKAFIKQFTPASQREISKPRQQTAQYVREMGMSQRVIQAIDHPYPRKALQAINPEA